MIAFTTLVGQYNAALLTLADTDFGHIALDSRSRIMFDHSSSSVKIGDGTDILDILVWNDASAGTEKGLLPFGIYKTNPTNLADADGDFVPFQFDASGRLRVDAEISIETGSDKAEDSAHASGDIGSYCLGVRQDTLATDTSTDGDYQSFKMTALGELYVKATDTDSLLTTIDSVLDAIAVDVGNIDDNITLLTQEEDTAHSSGDRGVMSLGVANEALADLVNADGDYTPLAVNKKGQLYTVTELMEQGTEADQGVDEANDGLVSVAYHATNFTDMTSIAVAAGTTLKIHGYDASADVLTQIRLVTYKDDGGSPVLDKVLRTIPITENVGHANVQWNRAIEVVGGTNVSVVLQGRCLRLSKTANCGGGINAYL